MVNDMANDLRTELMYLIESTPDTQVDAAIFIADHLIANGVTVQQWIPVTERLPEKNTDVLIYNIEEYMGTDFLTKDGKWFWNEELPPTHWMPLPEPPKEGDQ